MQAASGIVTHMKKTLDPARPLRNWISLMLCVMSISMDPLFFYIPMIKIHKNCLDLDKKLGVIACVFRSVIDLFYIIYISYYIGYKPRPDILDNSGHYNSPFIELMAVLPLPQVVIIIIVSKMSLTYFLEPIYVLKYFVLLQFVPRVIRIYPLFKKATSSRILTEVAWAKAAINLYLYVISGLVFGALWYFFAIEREIERWKKVCMCRVMNQTKCNHQSFNCRENPGNYRILHDKCSTKPHDYGIYRDALQSGVVEGSFLHKFMYCFRWGLQSLSCFAQNLTTSIDIWENIFTILITISSVVLFIFFLGNMQLYLQIRTVISEELKLRVREIEVWPSFKNLPVDLRKRVLDYQRHVWQETRGVDADKCLNKLPNDLRREIKHAFCLKEIEKVPEFRKFSGDEPFLDALYNRLKLVLYQKDIYIVKEGGPVDKMLFIIRGNLTVETANGEIVTDQTIDIYGKELLKSDHQPISDKTVKVQSAVEAFALEADDLKSLAAQFKLNQVRHINGGSSEEENKSQDEIVTNADGATTYTSQSTASGNRAIQRTNTRKRTPDTVEPSEIPDQKPVEPDFIAKEK
ncbi:hypothetical protein Dsin_011930 [Dipteronia sinensis]|uniref:Cyclic nucleotide-binding domain-containing protein n=1 Tax=Dipteronia sinensis TaxID=43782 RepID=A0AAE0E8Y4_9ROSI|nr:hypothetical protein Dsin_011930 [Dipteronia sinensis]